MSTLAPPHPVVLEGLIHLANFLITQTDIIENEEEEDKKRSFVSNKVPSEIVKDPSGLARELLWRVQRELKSSAVKEEITPPPLPTEPISHNGISGPQPTHVAAKAPRPSKVLQHAAVTRTVNFQPV